MNRIKFLRQEKKIKQIDLCKQIGVSQAALSGYETEKYQPDFETLRKIANFFNVSVDYIICNSDKKNETTQNEQSLTPKQEELFKTFETLSTTEIEKVLEFSRFLKSQRKTELD